MAQDAPYNKAALTETEFHQRIDALMLLIEDAVADQADDCDAERSGGILTLSNERGKIILSRQSPLRELWLAAKGGGFHFRFDGQSWVDTRDGEALEAKLHKALEEIGEREIKLEC
jgi:CyaY protein